MILVLVFASMTTFKLLLRFSGYFDTCFSFYGYGNPVQKGGISKWQKKMVTTKEDLWLS